MADKQEYIEAMAAELRAEKAAKRMTLDDLSEASGVPKSSLVRYLDGTRDIPGSTFQQLCDGLTVDPAEMMTRARHRLMGKS